MEVLYIAIYHSLPITMAAVCNMVFLGSRHLAILNHPLDFHVTLGDGERLFGENKTWKGLVGSAFFFSIWHVFFEFLQHVAPALRRLSLNEGSALSGQALGCLIGLAATLSELPNSFLKRRRKIPPGSQSGCFGFLFDQADSPLGVTFAFYLIFRPSFVQLLVLFLLGTSIHLVANLLDACVGLKRKAAQTRDLFTKRHQDD